MNEDSITIRWRKASFSASDGDCVELADLGDSVGMRDSKDPDGAVLHFSRPEMKAFLAGCRGGEFDDLS